MDTMEKRKKKKYVIKKGDMQYPIVLSFIFLH